MQTTSSSSSSSSNNNNYNNNTTEKDFNFFYRQDLLKLLNNFYQLETFSFEAFKTLWNLTKFYQLFAIPRFFSFDFRYVEYLYDEELYAEVRTAALYTIYAIYFNQINRPKLKVPVTPNQWIEILKFIDAINQADHVDVEYTFRHLLHSDAFEFCSTFEIKNRNILSFKIGNIQKSLKTNIDDLKSEYQLNMNDFKEFVFNDELNEQIGTIHEAYMQCKDELVQASSSSKSLSTYINSNFKDLIGEKILTELEKEIKENEIKKESKETVFDKIKRNVLEQSEQDEQEVTKAQKQKKFLRSQRIKRQLNTLMDNQNESEQQDEQEQEN